MLRTRRAAETFWRRYVAESLLGGYVKFPSEYTSRVTGLDKLNCDLKLVLLPSGKASDCLSEKAGFESR